MNLKQASETFSIVSCSTRDNSPHDLCIMSLYRYMDKVDNEGNNEEYFPLKFQDNTYFNFATNIGQKLPLVLTDLLSSCHFFSKDIVIFHSIDDTNQFPFNRSYNYNTGQALTSRRQARHPIPPCQVFYTFAGPFQQSK